MIENLVRTNMSEQAEKSRAGIALGFRLGCYLCSSSDEMNPESSEQAVSLMLGSQERRKAGRNSIRETK